MCVCVCVYTCMYIYACAESLSDFWANVPFLINRLEQYFKFAFTPYIYIYIYTNHYNLIIIMIHIADTFLFLHLGTPYPSSITGQHVKIKMIVF